MKIFKIVIGIILIFFGTVTVIQMLNEERGAGLLGVFTGYAIILIISIWLIYSSVKKPNETKDLTRNLFSTTSQQKNNNLSIIDQKQSLEILRDKGVLNESEYEEKLNILEEQLILKKVQSLSEYLNLKKLCDSDLLSKEQFENKIKSLFAEYKEYYSIFGDDKYPEFTWDLYKFRKINKKIKPYEYEESDLIGKWNLINGKLFFYNESGLNKLKITWTNGVNRYGKWELKRLKLNISLFKTFGSNNIDFKIEELGSHVFVYTVNGKEHTAIKDLSENKNVW